MPERATVTQGVQLGIEAVPGALVPATRRLQSISIEPEIMAETNAFRPYGTKYDAVVPEGREWSAATVVGIPTFNELQYILASCFANAVPTQIMDGATPTGAWRWQFQPSTTTEDTPQTYTVEQGSPVRAQRFPYGIFSEFGLTWSRQKFDLNATMFGQRLQDGVTMTGSPVSQPLIPMIPAQIDTFLDDTPGALGTTKFLRALSGSFKLASKFGPLWTLNTANPSWAAHIETLPKLDLGIRVEADAAGMALLNTLRAGATKFVRFQVTGPQIYAAATVIASAPPAPTLTTATTGGTIAPGTYQVALSYTNATGSTVVGPTSTIVVPAGTATNAINVAAVTPLPANATGVAAYVSQAGGGVLSLGAITPTTGAAAVIGAIPAAGSGAVPVINGTGLISSYLFQLDIAAKIVKANKFADDAGVYAIEWPFVGVHDPTFGRAIQATLINTLSAL